MFLQGCGTSTVSKEVNDSGIAKEVVFPDISKKAMLKQGTFPNIENLRKVGAGLNKDQLYNLLGEPHFEEGFFSVREWDYIFNFKTGNGAQYVTCQYKVTYDKNMLAKSFSWLPAACASQLDVKAPVVTERTIERVVERPVVVAAPVVPQKMQIKGDALFKFNRSSINDLQPGGLAELNRVSADLKALRVDRVEVTGHTDKLGSPQYNQQLSLARAQTVQQFLIERLGLAPSQIKATGAGESMPLVSCNKTNANALQDCLAANRRVDILGFGVGTK